MHKKKLFLFFALVLLAGIIFYAFAINKFRDNCAFSLNTELNIPANKNDQPSVSYNKISLISGKKYLLEAEYSWQGNPAQHEQFYFDLYIPGKWDKSKYNFIPPDSKCKEGNHSFSKSFLLTAPETSMFFRVVNTSNGNVKIKNLKIIVLSELNNQIMLINNFLSYKNLSIFIIIIYFLYIIFYKKIHFLFNLFFILGLNSLFLTLLNINFLLQILILILFLIFSWIGLILLGNMRKKIPDTIMLLCISVIIGMMVFTIFNFVFLHFNNSIASRIFNFIFFFTIVLSAVFFKNKMFSKINISISKPNILLILFVSFILSATTNYGFLNKQNSHKLKTHFNLTQINELDWGWNADKLYHINKSVISLNKTGFPEKELSHRGIQILLISISRLIIPFNTDAIIITTTQIYKIICFILYFVLLYSFAFIGKYFFSLSKNYVSLIIISIPFFNAINYPLFTVTHSAYLGSFSAGASMFHNATQFFSITIGITGIILIIFAHKKMKRAFIYGCFIIACSFFFKPSFYALVVPVIFIFYTLSKNIKLPDKLFGFSLLLITPLFWNIYPKYFSIKTLKTPVEISPFELLFNYASQRFPSEIYNNKFIFASMILILSFAIFIPILINFIITKSKSWKSLISLNKIKSFFDFYFIEIFFATIFISGTLIKLLLIENNSRRLHGNFEWFGSIGYILFIPVMIKLISKIKIVPILIFTFVILFLHLWGGALHLYLFTFKEAL